MTISTGQTLPIATFLKVGANGPEQVDLTALTAGRRVVIFAVPGAYTGTCSTAHVPSFIRTAGQFADKGVDEIVCVSVNDPFVMRAWGEATGAGAAGIAMLADPRGDFTKAIGMEFDAPPAGLFGRSNRYAMLVEDGSVRIFQVEQSNAECTVSGGEALLEAI